MAQRRRGRDWRQLRLDAGLTQVQLAKDSGVTRGIISGIETEQALATAETTTKLEAALTPTAAVA